MASILRTNSGRTALRCFGQSFASTSHTSFIPSRFSSVRYISCGRDPISRSDEIVPIVPPVNWGIHIVPEMTVFVIERFGKYFKTLPTGIHFLIPFVDRIAYVHGLRYQTIGIPKHLVITKDNMTILIDDGLIIAKIVDPKLASYGVEDPNYAVIKLAQTTMRNEFGKIIFDKAFTERKRDTLNEKIVESINVAAKSWGLECLLYEAARAVQHIQAFSNNIP